MKATRLDILTGLIFIAAIFFNLLNIYTGAESLDFVEALWIACMCFVLGFHVGDSLR